MSTIWFTSDLHFFHQNIIKYSNRPFASIEEMNEGLIAAWNKRVTEKDAVYVIGDFMMGHNFKSHLPWITPRLNGYKILVKGNHDRSSELYLSAGFAEVHNEVILETPQFEYPKILLQHKPPAKATGPFPYAYVLHGHVHGMFKTRGYWINVGVDVQGYEPKTFEELITDVEPHIPEAVKNCMNCNMPTTEGDSICSFSCHAQMWEEEYDQDRQTRRFR